METRDKEQNKALNYPCSFSCFVLLLFSLVHQAKMERKKFSAWKINLREPGNVNKLIAKGTFISGHSPLVSAGTLAARLRPGTGTDVGPGPSGARRVTTHSPAEAGCRGVSRSRSSRRVRGRRCGHERGFATSRGRGRSRC